MNKNYLMIMLVSTIGCIGSSQAAVVGGSDSESLSFGAAYDNSGTAGAGVVGELYNLEASFQNHLADYSEYDSTTGVYSFAGSDLEWVSQAGGPDHTGLGLWEFKQVGSADVWYGNWAEEDSSGGAVSGTEAVFYVGADASTSVPSSGSSSYSVSGLTNSSAAYSGTFTANWASATLTGSLTASGLATFNLGTASISSTGVISGTNAYWSNATSTYGSVAGQFYGSSQSQLAGYANFSDASKDISFGGSKQ